MRSIGFSRSETSPSTSDGHRRANALVPADCNGCCDFTSVCPQHTPRLDPDTFLPISTQSYVPCRLLLCAFGCWIPSLRLLVGRRSRAVVIRGASPSIALADVWFWGGWSALGVGAASLCTAMRHLFVRQCGVVVFWCIRWEATLS